MKVYYMCEVCEEVFSTEQQAKACEEKHKNISDLKGREEKRKEIQETMSKLSTLKREYDEKYSNITLVSYDGKYYVDGEQTTKDVYYKLLEDFYLSNTL